MLPTRESDDSHHRGSERTGATVPHLQIRDLVLISASPLAHPKEGRQPAGEGRIGQGAVIGLVMSNRFVGGLRTADVTVSCSGWTRLVDAMDQRLRSKAWSWDW